MRKGLMAAALLGACLALVSPVEAARTDAYSAMLAEGSFTISYEDQTPASAVHNRKGVYLDWGKNLDDFQAEQPAYRGENRVAAGNGRLLISTAVVGGADLVLRTEAGSYSFQERKDKQGLKQHYAAEGGSRQVSLNHRYRLEELLDEPDYGNARLSRALNIITPAELKPAGTPVYYQAGSGSLPGGLFYEDYRADYDNGISAVRYYFQGNQMVKIAMVSYWKDKKGQEHASKGLLKINEFRSGANEADLNLPSDLTVKN